MELAATADDIEKNVADVTLTMVAPLPLTKVPKAGEETQVLGKLDSYTSSPFMINMIEGQLIAKPRGQETAPQALALSQFRKQGSRQWLPCFIARDAAGRVHLVLGTRYWYSLPRPLFSPGSWDGRRAGGGGRCRVPRAYPA